MTLVNSFTTISQHFSDGARSFSICCFTIASNAISGVNKPDLKKKTQKHDSTVLSTSFRKLFLLGALQRRSKFANSCHDLMQNHLS